MYPSYYSRLMLIIPKSARPMVTLDTQVFPKTTRSILISFIVLSDLTLLKLFLLSLAFLQFKNHTHGMVMLRIKYASMNIFWKIKKTLHLKCLEDEKNSLFSVY